MVSIQGPIQYRDSRDVRYLFPLLILVMDLESQWICAYIDRRPGGYLYRVSSVVKLYSIVSCRVSCHSQSFDQELCTQVVVL